MLLVIWHTFWPEERTKMTSCSDFTHELLGLSEATSVLMENQEDPESCMELVLRYDGLNHSKVTKWHELADFARLNELYVILYEQGSSEEKGYWYDEGDEWVSRNFGPDNRYENLLK